MSPIKLMTVLAAAGLLAALAPLPARAQDAAAAPKTAQNWKDRAEYDLFDSIGKETDPAKRLALLDEWKSKYPATDYKKERDTTYVVAYAQAGQPQKCLDAAKEALADNDDDVNVLYYATLDAPLAPPTPDNLDLAAKVAKALLSAPKPAALKDEDWDKAKKTLDFEGHAHATLGWVAMTRKDNDTAETEFTQSLKANPNQGQVSYWRGQAVLAEKKPEKQGTALYDFARAAAYDGPGALNPAGRSQIQTYLEKAYTTYHGGKDGMDALLAQAKTSAMPPDGFAITSVVDQQKAQIEKENELQKSNPSLALWKSIKDQLTGADGATYFTKSMKGADLPGGAGGVSKFTGKLVSMDPATRPKQLVVAISDATTPEVTLEFETALPGKADPGTAISFSGVAKDFTAAPFNLTFTVERKNLEGWPVKAEAPAVHHRPRTHH